MVRLYFFLVTVLYFSVDSTAQNLDYGREVINQLTDPSFHGRGYVGDGDKKAAYYIRDEFKRWGILPLGNSYFQEFSLNVNTFPGLMSLEIDDQKLTPGVDYIIDPASPGIQGDFTVLEVDISRMTDPEYLTYIIAQENTLLSYSQPEITNDTLQSIIQWLKYEPNLPFTGLLEKTDNKLTWGTASYQLPRPTILLSWTGNAIDRISVNIESQFYPDYETQNVVGYIEGDRQDSILLLMAHYDHLGRMGTHTIFPGANDNASGVAMLLNLAKYFSHSKPSKSIVLVAFGGEEAGLLGAKYFVSNPPISLDKIQFMLNFDIAGTGDEGIQVVNGSVYPDLFGRLTQLNDQNQYLPNIKIRGAACISDHCLFDQKNIPGFYIYTLGGIQAYHDVHDRGSTLPLTEFEDYLDLMICFINTF